MAHEYAPSLIKHLLSSEVPNLASALALQLWKVTIDYDGDLKE